MMTKQSSIKSEDVVGAILIVAIILIWGFFVWSWFAWFFGALNKWYPLNWKVIVGFFVTGTSTALIRAGMNSDA